MTLIGVDIGTSSLKAGAVNSQTGEFICVAQQQFELIHPHPGWSEMPAAEYVNAFKTVLNKLSESVDLNTVEAISISGQGQTFVPVDKYGNVLQNVWTWIDSRADREAETLNAKFTSDEFFRKVGMDGVSPGSFSSMVKHTKDKHKDVYGSTWKFLHICSYLIYLLTGETVWDANIAAMSALYDWRKQCWWNEILEAVGVNIDMLPRVEPSGQIAGTIHSSAANEFNLPKGAHVVTGANDQTANAIGSGLIDETRILTVFGTALIGFKVFGENQKPQEQSYHGICSIYPVGQRSYQLGFTTSGCGTFDWWKNLLEPDMSYDKVFEHIDEVPPGSDGLTSLIDFDGRAYPPNRAYRGTVAGISRKTNRFDLLRASAEGIAFTARELIEKMLQWNIRGKEIRIAGGAARSKVWLGIIAGVLGVPLETLHHDEAGVAGSAIMAGVACGKFKDYHHATKQVVKPAARIEPDEEKIKLYESYYQRFLKLRQHGDEFYK